MSDYETISKLLKDARKKARALKHDPGKVEALRSAIEAYRTKDRKRLLRYVSGLYSFFDAKYADPEVADYISVLKASSSYALDDHDRELIALDLDYLAKYRKNIASLKSEYSRLEQIITERPLDQDGIDLGITSMLNIIDYLEAYKLDEMRAEINTRLDAVGKSKSRYTLAQKAVMLAACVVIGIGAVTADFSIAKGFAGFGGTAAMAGEMQQDRSVDQILASIKNKVFVNKDTYLQEVAKSRKAVVFFYEGENDHAAISHNFAKIWVDVLSKYPNIKLICYDKDKENYSGQFYINNFGIHGVPFYEFVAGGKIVYKHKGGPTKAQMAAEIITQNKNMSELSNM